MIIKFADAWKVYDVNTDWKWVKKRPITVKAIQMDCDFEVKTEEGIMTGKKGDWLIKGFKEEVYPCKREIFEETYDEDGTDNTQTS